MGIVVSLTMDLPQDLHRVWAIHMVGGVHQGRLDTRAVRLRRQTVHLTTSGVLALWMDRLSQGTPEIVTSVVSNVSCERRRILPVADYRMLQL